MMGEATCNGGCGCGERGPGAGSEPVANRSVPVTRRGVLAGSAAVVATLALGACSDSDQSSGGSTPGKTTEQPAGGPAAPSDAGSGGEVLATTGEFPTGGGKVVSTASAGVVVVTQPADGEFKAFSGKCPHQGCPVTEVLENTIICNCHGSTFDAATGDRLEGPAPVGLTPVAVSVQGDDIVLA